MSWFEAIILGLIQGFTEFLPVSSSGHLELGKALLGLGNEAGLGFTVAVHGATVLSTVVVFRSELVTLASGAIKFKMNWETRYVLMLLFSMIPVGLAGFLMKDQIEGLFDGSLVLVGSMLIVTSALLFMTRFTKDQGGEITFGKAIIIGIAQAIAVIPGISRSGATISTGMMLGISRGRIAEFSFLMVLVPVIGANIIEFTTAGGSPGSTGIFEIGLGFLAAFASGFLACKVMIALVKKSKLLWFSIYCLAAGLLSIILG
jgi:undecaprenyl-diphosphatase